MRRASALASIALAVLVAACEPAPARPDQSRRKPSRAFPTPDRPVSELGSNAFSNERDREERREATTVMDLAGVQAGMSVADIGAGEGYYTVRLAERVSGPRGACWRRISMAMRCAGLVRASRRDRLDNVSIKPGGEDDPRCPSAVSTACSSSTCIMKWPSPMPSCGDCGHALKPGGQRSSWSMPTDPTDHHGIPPHCCFANWRRWAFAWRNFTVSPSLRAITRSSWPAEIRGRSPEAARRSEPCRFGDKAKDAWLAQVA